MADGTCFVIQGFGQKVDYATGRTLNLDASYEMIKEAVEGAGLKCMRADEVWHAGTIGIPMFELILNADLVIADLSTNDPNTLYGLGVRHALRPQHTIVIAESRLRVPFDFGHVVIRTYEHLGAEIGFVERMRFKAELTGAIADIMRSERRDSPVYTFLSQLQPPTLARALQGLREHEAPSLRTLLDDGKPSLRTLLDAAKKAIDAREYGHARELLKELRSLAPDDPQVVRMLAYVTWKTEDPNREASLFEARGQLATLEPTWSNDPETLAQWAAVHERLWESLADGGALDESIQSYDQVFHLRRDVDSGTRLAYLLNVRASRARGLESVGDWVMAQRVRRRVLEIGQRALSEINPEEQHNAMRYRILTALQEAAIGVGDSAAAQEYGAAAAGCDQPLSTRQATDQQLRRLGVLVEAPPKDARDVRPNGTRFTARPSGASTSALAQQRLYQLQPQGRRMARAVEDPFEAVHAQRDSVRFRRHPDSARLNMERVPR